MNENKNFEIYSRSDGFKNQDKLNDMGKGIFIFFQYMEKNIYFNRIDKILITSQDRPTDAEPYHKDGNAVDFVIYPIPYNLYYAGIISACYRFNVLIGTYKGATGQDNIHLHVDKTRINGINKKLVEIPYPKKSLKKPSELNLDELFKIYQFSGLYSIQDFGNFKKDTKNLLLTEYPINDKLSINDFITVSVRDKLKEYFDSFDFTPLYIIMTLAGLYFLNSFMTNINKLKK